MKNDQKRFIDTIGEAAVCFYETYQILPSLTIAQAILESNWGKSGLSKTCHNFFGMKWTAGCGCDYKEYTTREQRKDGTYYTVFAKFRKYESVKEGIRGYYEFLQYKRYQNLKGVINPIEACDLIRKDGWATSLQYSTNLMKLITTYQLIEYDKKVSSNKGTDIFKPYSVEVMIKNLNIRKGPGTNFPKIAYVKSGRYTIIEEANGTGATKWGKLESNKGWISLDYVMKK
jgi:flagellum-specific peptidoglycan hydrolase FlgJ